MNFGCSLYILDTSPLLDMCVQKFLPVCGLFFIFLRLSLQEHNFLILTKFNFLFNGFHFWCYTQETFA